MVEVSDFVRSGPVWIVPYVIIDGPEAIQSILDLYGDPMVRNCAISGILIVGNRHRLIDCGILEHLTGEKHLFFDFGSF